MIGKLSVLAAVTCILFVGAATAQRRNRTTAVPQPTPTPIQLTTDQIIGQEPGKPLVTPEQVEQIPDSTSTEQPPAQDAPTTEALLERIKALESSRADKYDEQQKRLLMNLDILTRAEQRTENLRKQSFELMEKEAAVQAKLDQLAYESRPEMINRVTTQMGGSMRPEEVREARAKSLAAEQAIQQKLLAEIQAARARVDAGLERSESLVEKLRQKIEKDIDDALSADKPTQ
ncbi:MAG: hypothetical protein DYH05_07205 [Acidobacteria bacterium ACB1]|nr:hypothetical protein [Pyrinomonadaceae bacterium]MCE7962274.1 hypothetical protein [Acidobacteria bacterium ACB1]RIJ89021.1 MAG: hypothetical protein DCC44_12390 [Acidobacteriota bacterium]